MSAKLMRFVGNYDVNAEGKFLFEILAQVSFTRYISLCDSYLFVVSEM